MTHFEESMDGTIDHVARAMTAVPSPALAARVVARLRPQPSRRAAWLAPAAAIVATATVVLVVVIRSRPVAVLPATVASTAAVQHPVVASVPTSDVQQPDARRLEIVRVDTTMHANSEAAAWSERAVPALKAVPELSVTAIQPSALPIAQLEVAPIAPAEPLVVKAIGSDR